MKNAELRRYAWLELGLHRVVAVPVVLALLTLMVIKLADKPAEALSYASLTVFFAVTFAWGAARAYASVLEEVQDRTWDFQRMSALDPRQLAWGKVFGAPVMAWYIGLWCLVVFVVASVIDEARYVVATVVLSVAVTVLLHSLCVAASALAARATVSRRSRRLAGIAALLALLWGFPLFLAFSDEDHSVVNWWLLHGIPMRRFAALSAVLFAAWGLFAAWRAMARELREPAWWWGWPAFAAFFALWVLGISSPAQRGLQLGDVLAMASVILAAGGYLGLSLDPVTPVSWARLVRRVRAGTVPWHARAPLWVLHGGLAIAVALVAFTAAGTPMPDIGRALTWAVPSTVLAFALMMLRDGAFVTLFTLTTRVRRPLPLATFYLVVADALLPGLFATLGQPALARAAFPFFGLGEHTLYPAVGFAVHLVLVLAVLGWRMRRLQPV